MKGCKVLSYARHLWALSSECSSVSNDRLRGPMTLTTIAKCLAAELSLRVVTNEVCCGRDSNNKPSAWGAYALTAVNKERQYKVKWRLQCET